MLKQQAHSIAFVIEAFDTPVCRMAAIEYPNGNHITIDTRHG